MPYISKHQWNATVSLEHKRYELNVNARYTGAFLLAGQSDIFLKKVFGLVESRFKGHPVDPGMGFLAGKIR